MALLGARSIGDTETELDVPSRNAALGKPYDQFGLKGRASGPSVAQAEKVSFVGKPVFGTNSGTGLPETKFASVQ
jgi:hypothetical protein